MSTSDFERIDSLMKLCEDHQKSLRGSLDKVTLRVTQVSDSMSQRLTKITQKMTALRSKFDHVHTKNQKGLDKIKEKLDEINGHEMEANREFEEFRRKVNVAKRQRRKHGLIRHFGDKLYNYGISFLALFGLHQPPPVKKVTKEIKKDEIVPIVSPSQQTLTLVRPETPKAITPPKSNPSELAKKQI